MGLFKIERVAQRWPGVGQGLLDVTRTTVRAAAGARVTGAPCCSGQLRVAG